MNDQELKNYLMQICAALEKLNIEILMVLRIGENARIAGTMCPVCALEELQEFITDEEIEHNKSEIVKVH